MDASPGPSSMTASRAPGAGRRRLFALALGAVAGVIGSIQATEAIKLLLSSADHELLVNRLFVYDAWRMTARCVRVTRRPECRLCGRDWSGASLDER